MILINDVSTVIPEQFDLRSNLASIERITIRCALHASGADRTRAAKLLGISLRSLYYKLRIHNLGVEFPLRKVPVAP